MSDKATSERLEPGPFNIGCRVTEDNKERVVRRAAELGKSVTEYIRDLISDDLVRGDDRLSPRKLVEIVNESNQMVEGWFRAFAEDLVAVRAAADGVDELRRGVLLVLANLLHLQGRPEDERNRLLREALKM